MTTIEKAPKPRGKRAAKILLIVFSTLVLILFFVCTGALIFFRLFSSALGGHTASLDFQKILLSEFMLLPVFIIISSPLIVSFIFYRSQLGKKLEQQRYRGSIISSLIFVIIIGAAVACEKYAEWQKRAEIKENTAELAAPVSGLLIPTKDSLPAGFTEKEHTFRKSFYRMVYTAPVDHRFTVRNGQSNLMFIETLGGVCKVSDFLKPSIQLFTYNGSPVQIVVTPSVAPVGLVSYILYYNDQDKCLQIVYDSLPIDQSKPEDVIKILGTLVRSQ